MKIFLNLENLISTNKLPGWIPFSGQCSVSELSPLKIVKEVCCDIGHPLKFVIPKAWINMTLKTIHN